MTEKDEIRELFSKTFEGYEKQVDPGLWDKIQTNLNGPTGGGAGQAAGASGKAGLIKTIAVATVSVASVTAGIWYFTQDKNESPENQKAPVVQTQDDVQEEIANENVVVIKENVELIDTSNDPVIIEHKEEIKKEILEDLNNPESFNYSDINDLLDQDLLKELAKQDAAAKNQANVDAKTEEEKNYKEIVKEDSKKEELTHATNPNTQEEVKTKSEEEVFMENIPNVITPNGDYKNDYLDLNNDNISNFELLVLSEGNKVLFQRAGKTIRWNGQDLYGKELKEDRYRIMIIATTMAGKKLVRKGYFYIQK